MTETNTDPASEQTLTPVLSEAQRVLEEIKQVKAQAEENLKAAELARNGQPIYWCQAQSISLFRKSSLPKTSTL